jgi:hypothetical protein
MRQTYIAHACDVLRRVYTFMKTQNGRHGSEFASVEKSVVLRLSARRCALQAVCMHTSLLSACYLCTGSFTNAINRFHTQFLGKMCTNINYTRVNAEMLRF